MMPYQKANMKDLLAQSLYILIKEKPFDKITIKQICDKTGVIRGTFYNHFMDKYEALEYLTRNLIYDDVMSKEQVDEKFRALFVTVYQEKDFFIKGFQVEGQNSFESILVNVFTEMFMKTIDNGETFQYKKIIPIDFLTSYYANAIIYIIKYWIKNDFQQSPEDIYMISKMLLTNTLEEIL